MKTSAKMSRPAVLMALGMGALIPSRLRNALDTMSPVQRKAIRLPHVGAKEIAKHERHLSDLGLAVLDHDCRMYYQNAEQYCYAKWGDQKNV